MADQPTRWRQVLEKPTADFLILWIYYMWGCTYHNLLQLVLQFHVITACLSCNQCFNFIPRVAVQLTGSNTLFTLLE
jgi:hypothetical protein